MSRKCRIWPESVISHTLKCYRGSIKKMLVALLLGTIHLVSHSFLFWSGAASLDLLRPRVTRSSIVVLWVSQGCLQFPLSTPACATDLNLASSLCRR